MRATTMLPLQVSVHGTTLTDAIRELIGHHAQKLAQFYDRITACRVVVDERHFRMGRAIRYDVRIDLTAPGKEIAVRGKIQPDLITAIQDAFEAARRQLQDFARRQRGDVKQRTTPGRAVVATLHPSEGYGFLRTADGREIYFHRNSVLDHGFERLDVGTRVRFAEEAGADGPQASTVALAAGKR